jgi:hypothetical protein
MGAMIKRRFVIGAAGLAALSGGGVAYAVSQGSARSERQAFLDDVAGRLHVSPSQLRSALEGAFSDRLDAAVKAGRLTQSQADAIEKGMREHGGVPFLGGPPHHMLFGGPGGPFKAGFDAAASYLGLSAQQLHDQLESGKSLADVAKDRDKDVGGLKKAIEDSVRSRLDTAVKNGRITKAQESRILGDLSSRIDRLVNLKGGRPLGWRERGMRGDGPGPGLGTAPGPGPGSFGGPPPGPPPAF